MSTAVREVLTEWTRFEDRYGPYELEEHLEDVLHREIPERLASLLGAPPGDTTVCTGASDAFAAVLSRLPLGPRDRVWTTPYESVTNLTALLALRARTRCRLDVVPLRPDGDLDLEWMEEHIGDDVALVCVPYVSAGCGIVNPVEEIGRVLAPHRCLYAVDASYAVGQLPVDVTRVGCHLLTGDGWRFLCGPQSVGFAYVARRLRQLLHPYGGLSLVPPHGAAVAALNAALARRTPAPAQGPGNPGSRLRAAVENASGTELLAPGRTRSGIVTFRHEELPAAQVRRRLADRGVVVWKTVAHEIPLYLPGRGVATAVRASAHPDIPAEDIELFADALRDTVAEGRPRLARATSPLFVASGAESGPGSATGLGPGVSGAGTAGARRAGPGRASALRAVPMPPAASVERNVSAAPAAPALRVVPPVPAALVATRAEEEPSDGTGPTRATPYT